MEGISKNLIVGKTNSPVINSATFTCSDNKTVQSIFFEDNVELNLSDGRHMLLAHALSGSGARYTNSDESFVFWNKGNTAFIEEKGATTFKDCMESVDRTKKN